MKALYNRLLFTYGINLQLSVVPRGGLNTPFQPPAASNLTDGEKNTNNVIS